MFIQIRSEFSLKHGHYVLHITIRDTSFGSIESRIFGNLKMLFINVTIAVPDGRANLVVCENVHFDKWNQVWSHLF